MIDGSMAAKKRRSLSFGLAYFPSCRYLNSKKTKTNQSQQLDALCARNSAAEAVKLSADEPSERHVTLRLRSLVTPVGVRSFIIHLRHIVL